MGAIDCGQAGGSDGGSMRPLAGSAKASNGDHYQMCDVARRQAAAAAMGKARGGRRQMACLEENNYCISLELMAEVKVKYPQV